MFRNILLKYFPKNISKSELSPINFHLKLINPKLLYGISTKYGIENRRAIQMDTGFSYFVPYTLKFKDSDEEYFFYAYKVYSNLNWFDNYNIYTILNAYVIFTLNTYYDYFNENEIIKYINPFLYAVDYVILMFFAWFKQYEFDDDNKNLHFLINLLRATVYHLEITQSPQKDLKQVEVFVKKVMDIFDQEPDFLMLLYKTTKQISNVYENRAYTDVQLYNYFVSGMMMDFPDKDEFSRVIGKTTKNVFLKRYTYYLDVDMITMLNMMRWDTSYIAYFSNPNNADFLDYFVDSLDYIKNITPDLTIQELVDKILDFDAWSEKYINALKDYNSDNIEIDVDPSLGLEQIQEMMSSEMMENVKKVSSINEQFLDYYLLLINRKLNRNGDNLQLEVIENKKLKKNTKLDYDKKYYYKLDDLYFMESYYLKHKKNIKKITRFVEYTEPVAYHNVALQARKTILQDFNQKTNIETISNTQYFEILKKYFQQDILELWKSNLKKSYLTKHYSTTFSDYTPSDREVKNFKKNIYYPDFIVYYEFLKYVWIKFKPKDILSLSRLRESLFGYMIYQNIIWYSQEFKDKYNLYVQFDVTWFYEYFVENYPEFIDFFSKIKQNNRFVEIVKNIDETTDNIFLLDFVFVYDNLVDITYYNKRMFEI